MIGLELSFLTMRVRRNFLEGTLYIAVLLPNPHQVILLLRKYKVLHQQSAAATGRLMHTIRSAFGS